MPNPSYLGLGAMRGQLLCSTRVATTSPTSVYTVPAASTAKLATGSLCNASSSPVTVSLGLLPVGGVADGTHLVISQYVLAARDTLTLTRYLMGAMLAEGEAVSVTASVADVLCVVLSGAVST